MRSSVLPVDYAINPDDPVQSPLYFEIMIREMHISRWREVHELFKRVMEEFYSIDKFPELGPEHVIRYTAETGGDIDGIYD
jgi:hypothetical protein